MRHAVPSSVFLPPSSAFHPLSSILYPPPASAAATYRRPSPSGMMSLGHPSSPPHAQASGKSNVRPSAAHRDGPLAGAPVRRVHTGLRAEVELLHRQVPIHAPFAGPANRE